MAQKFDVDAKKTTKDSDLIDKVTRTSPSSSASNHQEDNSQENNNVFVTLCLQIGSEQDESYKASILF